MDQMTTAVCVPAAVLASVLAGEIHRVHRVATAAFWRTFHHEGKISPGW